MESVCQGSAGVRVADTGPADGKLCRVVADAGNAALFDVVERGPRLDLDPVSLLAPRRLACGTI